MARKIKVKAKLKTWKVTKEQALEVKVLMKHPMDTGLAKNKKTKEVIPAHFITELTCQLNGSDVLTGDLGGSVSKNPYISFYMDASAAKKGDELTVSWVDNMGEKSSGKAKVK